MAANKGGNIADLNISVTSNIDVVNKQLTALQKTLTTISKTNVKVNTGNISNSINAASSDFQSFANQISSSLPTNRLTNFALGFGIIGKEIKSNIGNIKEMSNSISNMSTSFTKNNIDKVKISDFLNAFKRYTTDYGKYKELMNTKATQPNAIEFQNIVKDMAKIKYFSQSMFDPNGLNSKTLIGFSSLLKVAKTGVLAIGAVIATSIVVGLAKAVSLTKDLVIQGLKYQSMVEKAAIAIQTLSKKSDENAKYQMPEFDKNGIAVAKTVNDEIEATSVLMKSLQRYADFSTFTFPDLLQQTKLMQAYGLKSEDALHVLRMLGDTSMGDLNKLSQQAYALAQSITAGRLTGDNLRQFREGGFNPLLQLAEERAKLKGGKAEDYMPGLQEEVEAGTIGISELFRAFELATSFGGRFFGMQNKLADSAFGKISTIVDKWTRLVGESQSGLFVGLKPILDDIIAALDILLINVDDIAASFTENLLPVLEDVAAEFINISGVAENGGEVTNTIDSWTVALAGTIKMIDNLAQIFIVMVSGFTEGLLVVGGTFYSIFKGLEIVGATVFTGIGKVGIGSFRLIAEVAANVADFFYNKFKDKFNLIMSGVDFLREKLGKDPLNIKLGELPTDKALDNINKKLDTWSESLSEEYSSKINKYSNDITKGNGKALWDMAKKTSDIFMAATENVFSGAPAVKLKTDSTKPGEDIEKIGDKYTNAIKTSTSEVTKQQSAWNSVIDSIDKAVKKITSLDSVLGKISYEHFSPSKIQARMRRYLQEFEKWTTNIKMLAEQGLPDKMIAELQGMGVSGFGMTSALVKQSPEQRESFLQSYSKLSSLALTPAVSSVKFEHSGTLVVKGINNKDELVAIINPIIKDVLRDKKTNSLSPSITDTFKR